MIPSPISRPWQCRLIFLPILPSPLAVRSSLWPRDVQLEVSETKNLYIDVLVDDVRSPVWLWTVFSFYILFDFFFLEKVILYQG